MSFALDHDYCSVAPSDNDSKTEISIDEDATKPRAERKQAICPRVDPDMETSPVDETPDFEERSSSSSPAHSMDSGVDAGMEDFFADFPSSWAHADFGLNEEDLKELEDLLKLNELTNELPSAKAVAKTRPATKVTGEFGKRQRIMPEEDEEAIIERNRKNAVAARENRQKKKKYMEGLENEVSQLKEENKTLKSRNESLTSMMKKLSDEVKYLRNVLANESTISLLLKSVAATPGISLSSSLVQSSSSEESEKESEKKEGERQYVTRSRKRRSVEGVETAPSKTSRSTSSGGVCLHVNGGKVSLELCANCERKAMQSGVQ